MCKETQGLAVIRIFCRLNDKINFSWIFQGWSPVEIHKIKESSTYLF